MKFKIKDKSYNDDKEGIVSLDETEDHINFCINDIQIGWIAKNKGTICIDSEAIESLGLEVISRYGTIETRNYWNQLNKNLRKRELMW